MTGISRPRSSCLTDKMALGSLPSTLETWGHWPHPQRIGTEFDITDAGMVHYDCRTAATVPISRPELAQHYLPGPFSPGSMPALLSPQGYASVSCSGSKTYSSQPMLDAPFKSHECLEYQPRVLPVVEVQQRMDGLSSVKRSCSPSLQSEEVSQPKVSVLRVGIYHVPEPVLVVLVSFRHCRHSLL
ncbi:hypothetical protein N658DRAFT_500078 [Parathielavia hyrcaniae]|uniref:Uncharacterized protein n=1 Tax=Parathielavia hyrcaniae TaxID=113614 RepID=A0AAN6SXS4_9PEZI|nr:hypothetical protein N658DRAFT_500078 [Parathielavia hyrcaniae]